MSFATQWGFVSIEPPDDGDPAQPDAHSGSSMSEAVAEWLILLGVVGAFGAWLKVIVELLRMGSVFLGMQH
jgi:hypothetical protein